MVKLSNLREILGASPQEHDSPEVTWCITIRFARVDDIVGPVDATESVNHAADRRWELLSARFCSERRIVGVRLRVTAVS